jgi:hypothetical protein
MKEVINYELKIKNEVSLYKLRILKWGLDGKENFGSSKLQRMSRRIGNLKDTTTIGSTDYLLK